MKISCEAETHTLITLQQNDLLCTSGFVEAFAAPPWFQTLKLRSNMNHRASANSVNCAVVRRSKGQGGSRWQHAEEVVFFSPRTFSPVARGPSARVQRPTGRVRTPAGGLRAGGRLRLRRGPRGGRAPLPHRNRLHPAARATTPRRRAWRRQLGCLTSVGPILHMQQPGAAAGGWPHGVVPGGGGRRQLQLRSARLPRPQ